MLRVTVLDRTSDAVALKVEGEIAGKEVFVLKEEALRWLGEVRYLKLDLRGVQFVDRVGIGLLQQLPQDRLYLTAGSSFVRRLLEANGLRLAVPEG